jgi:hypothetical protein
MGVDEHDDQLLASGLANASADVPAVATSCCARPGLNCNGPEVRGVVRAAHA